MKNLGYSQIKKNCVILGGEISNNNENIEELSLEYVSYIKYAP